MTMSPELTAALERVKGYVMSPEEVFEQRVSFVYGQQDFDDPNPRTKDQIRDTLAKMHGRPPAPCDPTADDRG